MGVQRADLLRNPCEDVQSRQSRISSVIDSLLTKGLGEATLAPMSVVTHAQDHQRAANGHHQAAQQICTHLGLECSTVYLSHVVVENALKVRIMAQHRCISSAKNALRAKSLPDDVHKRIFGSKTGHSLSELAKYSSLARALGPGPLLKSRAWTKLCDPDAPYLWRYGADKPNALDTEEIFSIATVILNQTTKGIP